MGIVPIWGFQLITAIALAILFRLNKTLVIISANISIPPMLPVILYGSMLTGSLWVGKNAIYPTSLDDLSLAFVKVSLFQYVSGAITLALIAGLATGFFTFVFLQIFKRKRTVQKQ